MRMLKMLPKKKNRNGTDAPKSTKEGTCKISNGVQDYLELHELFCRGVYIYIPSSDFQSLRRVISVAYVYSWLSL